MCIRCFGFFFLLWFPAAFPALSAAQSCPAPKVDDGFFSPKHESYSHGTMLTYTCNIGRRPAVRGWWSSSTCQNGTWSHEPQCIDEKACLPPDIPNANYTESQSGWYKERSTVTITCDEGYEPKNQDVTAVCMKGTWTSVPVCEKSVNACAEPPKVLHAVIIHQSYRELFAGDSEVQYECEDGYTVDGLDNKKSIFCTAGSWTEAPTCNTYCSVNTADYPELQPAGVKFIKDGESVKLECVKREFWSIDRYSLVRCTEGRLTVSRCCGSLEMIIDSC